MRRREVEFGDQFKSHAAQTVHLSLETVRRPAVLQRELWMARIDEPFADIDHQRIASALTELE